MELKELKSKHLGVPFVYLKDKEKFLCENGVLFSKKEYLDGIDLGAEYARRKSEDTLYDYKYAKSTGVLRKQREPYVPDTKTVTRKAIEEVKAKEDNVLKEKQKDFSKVVQKAGDGTARSVQILSLSLLLTSFGCMYISTLHTATYLFDYVDRISAWLMSAVITLYCSTAFEVVILFHDRKRKVLAAIFAILWGMVTLFSMATTVSVFYERFNFTRVENQAVSSDTDSARLQLEILKESEKAIRESIAEKKADLEYRREKDYATTAVRTELNSLQRDLQSNLQKQGEVLLGEPNAVKDNSEVVRKETLFDFLGRILKVEGGILEFIMSTLSAVFINLIAPLSVSVVVSFFGGFRNENSSE